MISTEVLDCSHIPSHTGQAEYIVTCRSYDDLEDLYDDMETPGGSLYIPDRAVDLVHRRSISRNTHYMLTAAEAEELRNDERVIACELNPVDLNISPEPYWVQTGDFNKTSSTFSGDDRNWGLYRVIKGDSVANWGSDNSTEITNEEIITTASGRNVDVVIVDSHINPDHPEFAVNPDGTGGSRVNQFNWFQYNSALGNGANGTYDYSLGTSVDHGTHVAGTACGNTQGWARDANIYNMSFYDSDTGKTNWASMLWDYLRHFHKNKAINPATGRRNPTITNHSWGYFLNYSFDLSDISAVVVQGSTTIVSGTDSERKTTLEAAGVPTYANYGTEAVKPNYRYTAIEADIQDAIDDGVIIISSAGNTSYKNDLSTGADFNNYFVWNYLGTNYAVYFNKGGTPSVTGDVISVGSIGSKVAETKSNFSNWGPRVDIWAPGHDIISAIYDNVSVKSPYLPIVADSRNSSYYLASINGTSMASPQVCGVIACLAETEPNLTQAEALQYLKEHSLTEVGDPGGNPTSINTGYEAFGSSSNNRYLFIERKREVTGSLQQTRFKNRNPDTAGIKYPRTNNSVHK